MPCRNPWSCTDLSHTRIFFWSGSSYIDEHKMNTVAMILTCFVEVRWRLWPAASCQISVFFSLSQVHFVWGSTTDTIHLVDFKPLIFITITMAAVDDRWRCVIRSLGGSWLVILVPVGQPQLLYSLSYTLRHSLHQFTSFRWRSCHGNAWTQCADAVLYKASWRS